MATYLKFDVVKSANPDGTPTWIVWGYVQGLFSPYKVPLGSFSSETLAESAVTLHATPSATTEYDATGKKA